LYLARRQRLSHPIPKKNPADMGRALRQMMLTSAPEKSLTKPTAEFPRIYAVLTDWQIDEHIATIFSASTGDASLYTTSTFGIIGGQGHETVRNAAKSLCALLTGISTTQFPSATIHIQVPDTSDSLFSPLPAFASLTPTWPL
jgi:hypothetical protein